MRILYRIVPIVLATTQVCLAIGQTIQKEIPAEWKAAMDRAREHTQRGRDLYKLGLLDLAETQYQIAIQLLQGVGDKANGERAMLGTIVYERGLKREGYEILKEAYLGFIGGPEKHIRLGLMALEFGEIHVARASYERFHTGGLRVGALHHSVQDYLPQGKSLASLKAGLMFLDGAYIYWMNRPQTAMAVEKLRAADRLEPGNVAIQHGLARMKEVVKDYKGALEHFRFVAAHATGNLQAAAKRRVVFWEGAELDKPKKPATTGTATGAGGIG